VSETKEYQEGREARKSDPIGIICQSPYLIGSEQDENWVVGWIYEDDEIWFREYGINEWHTLNKAAHFAGITRKQLGELISAGKVDIINIGEWKYRVHGSEIQKIRDNNDLPNLS